MTLTDFLLARIAEDEERARWVGNESWKMRENGHEMVDASDGREVISYGGETNISDAEHIVRWHPARVLAECEAKRRIVEACEPIYGMDGWEYDDAPDLAWATLRALALPYVDHPDCDEEWKS